MDELMNFSSNAIVVLKKRYLKKNNKGEIIESPKQLLKRVSEAIASAEKKYESNYDEVKKLEKAFFEMMKNLEFMPNSPTLMNAGKGLGQLSACFVISVKDSMESIFDAIKSTALIHKSGGGTGFSFSSLRPKNSVVKSTGGVASGPVSFMKVFDSATQAVKQGGARRGANMGILRVDHPDIIEFIKCKEKEGDISNFNISVALTDDFMEKVIKRENFKLLDPHSGEATRELDASFVFDCIANYAYRNGEPGVIFIDKINKDNPVPQLGEIESTNPCVTGDTLISTEKGLLKMRDLVENYREGGIRILVDESVLELKEASSDSSLAVEVKRRCSLRCISRAFKTGVKPCYRVITESGYELTATADHGIMSPQGWIEVKDLKVGEDKLLIQPQEGAFNSDSSLQFKVENTFKGDNGRLYKMNLPKVWSKELGQVLGWLVGDGWLREGDKDCRVGFTFGEKDILEYFKYIINGFYGASIQEVKRENGVWHLSYHSKYFVDFFKKLGIEHWRSSSKEVPGSIFTAPKEAVVGFLQGLFSADGTLLHDEQHKMRYARLTSKSLRLIKGVQLLLLNLGVKSRIYDRSRHKRYGFKYMNKNGEEKLYLLDGELYELNISRESLKIFLEKIGFMNKKHQELVKKLKNCKYFSQKYEEKVVDIKYVGEKEVYDLTEPKTLSFITNGYVSRDCGEQPLLPYESCNLGSINLLKMLKEVNEEFELDWEKLERVTRLSVRFLDNVIDVNKFPFSQIKENTLKTRKIGLGIMGWATMLGFLGIPYDSDEAINLAGKVMGYIRDIARDESVNLGKKRGVFPSWEGSVWHKQGIKVRNATLTTIAPTGTIGIIAGPTSSGVEPNFSLCYFRNVLDGEKLLGVDPAFEYIARKEGFYTQELMEKIASGESIQKMEEVSARVKRVFKTAMEISPFWHIKMQAAFQEFTDNAVSKTINLSNGASVDDVKEAYLLAYKLNCKGVTVYRDGSRSVQVLTVDKKGKTGDTEAKAKAEEDYSLVIPYPKPRPEVILGTTTKVTTGCGNLYITVNQDEEGNFFEVFTQMGKAGGCAASQLEAVGRLVSLALRGGIDTKVIVEQLKGIRCPSPSWDKGKKIFSCADAIARVLEKRAVDQKEIVKVEAAFKKTKEKRVSLPVKKGNSNNVVGVCIECGFALRHQEGCLICDACGYSKC